MSRLRDDGPIGFQTKSELVYDVLRQEIIRGDLPGGARLEQEELAERFEVSRQPLRLALNRLVSEQLVEWQPHRSATVAELSREGFEEFYVMRSALEAALSRVAAPSIDDAVVERLRGLVDEMRIAVTSGRLERFVQLDRQFHSALYEPSGYVHAQAEVARLRDLTDRYIYCYVANDDGALRSISEHDSLVDAAADNDGDRLATLMAAHVEQGAVTLRRIIAVEQPSAVEATA